MWLNADKATESRTYRKVPAGGRKLVSWGLQALSAGGPPKSINALVERSQTDNSILDNKTTKKSA
jgi:hypothetical protein